MQIANIKNIQNIIDNNFPNIKQDKKTKTAVKTALEFLSQGKLSVAKKDENGMWQVSDWLQKAILLYFRISKSKIGFENKAAFFDKIPLKFENAKKSDFTKKNIRVVKGAIIRDYSFIGNNTVIMPSFVNIGSHIGDNTMIDSFATVGSCAYIGSNCHISMNVGIGGVLEPIGKKPVIIENNCFIGAGSQITEGTIIGEGAIIGMGSIIGSSIKIYDCKKKKFYKGNIPKNSVVVPGYIEGSFCMKIIKTVGKDIKSKVSINDLLREKD